MSEPRVTAGGMLFAIAIGLGFGVWQIFWMKDRGYLRNHGARPIPISDAFAQALADEIGLDTSRVPLAQFRRGLEVEQEHMRVTGLDFRKIAQIAIDHLEHDYDRKDYYDALDRMEQGGC